MKKSIIAVAFILLAGAAFSQTLQKGSILAPHVITVDLDPDVTYNQWKDYALTKYIPAYNKHFQGDLEMYYAEVDRGDDENGISLIWVFKSLEVRDKYFTKEGAATELWSSKIEKISQDLDDVEIDLGTTSISYGHYNDWVIQ